MGYKVIDKFTEPGDIFTGPHHFIENHWTWWETDDGILRGDGKTDLL
jgi:hypothetical protein